MDGCKFHHVMFHQERDERKKDNTKEHTKSFMDWGWITDDLLWNDFNITLTCWTEALQPDNILR